MRNLSADDIQLLQQIGKSYPRLVELLETVRRDELETLAVTTQDFFPVLKGRIGMLTELLKQLRPELP